MTGMAIKALEDILYDSDLDLRISRVVKNDPMQFSVESQLGFPRIFFGLLFGIPCLFLIGYALRQQGMYYLLPIFFCPPLAILAILFGLTKQKKTFMPSMGKATKTFQILHVRGDRTIQLPNKGVVATYKRWSSGGNKNPGGKYFYHAEILGLKGFGFCISKDEKKRNDFARELAGFLGYEIQDQGKRE